MPVFSNRHRINSDGSYNYVTDDTIDFYNFPVVERLWKDELFLHLYLAPPTNRADLDSIIEAFNKVWTYRDELR